MLGGAVRAGQLRERITIQRATVTTGTTGQPKTDWSSPTTVATVWASVQMTASDEGQSKSGAGVSNKYQVVMRYRSDVLSTDRLLWGSVILNIKGIVQDERKTQITLSCIEG